MSYNHYILYFSIFFARRVLKKSNELRRIFDILTAISHWIISPSVFSLIWVFMRAWLLSLFTHSQAASNLLQQIHQSTAVFEEKSKFFIVFLPIYSCSQSTTANTSSQVWKLGQVNDGVTLKCQYFQTDFGYPPKKR